MYKTSKKIREQKMRYQRSGKGRNRHKVANRRYELRQYGLSIEDYDVLFEKQNGLCAICGKPETAMFRGKVKPLFVDHDHITGKVRGLLCSTCNMRIGILEQWDFIVKAKKYLEENS